MSQAGSRQFTNQRKKITLSFFMIAIVKFIVKTDLAIRLFLMDSVSAILPQADYSITEPDSCTTLAHFFTSSGTNLANSG